MSEAFGITFIKAPLKKERRFIELQGDGDFKYRRDCARNFFRHFCQGRTAEQAIAACAEHCGKYLGMGDDLANFRKALEE